MVAALSQAPVVNAVAFWMYDSQIERAAFRSVIETVTNFEIEIALAWKQLVSFEKDEAILGIKNSFQKQ